MAPMALLTLPTDMLRDANAHPQTASPHGERKERLYAVALTAILMAAPLGLVLLPLLR